MKGPAYPRSKVPVCNPDDGCIRVDFPESFELFSCLGSIRCLPFAGIFLDLLDKEDV